MKKYVVITTSLLEANWEERMAQYMAGIGQIIRQFETIPDTRIVIVENTGKSSSFLDTFNIPVLYTNTNNEIHSPNKGIKELIDVFKVIQYFNIQDEDFLIKVTGRYFIHENSKFVNVIKHLDTIPYDVVCRYGGYNLPHVYMEKFYSVITGIIGMCVKYVKQIQIPDDVTCVEWKWADVANTLDESQICMLDSLGITQYISLGPVVNS